MILLPGSMIPIIVRGTPPGNTTAGFGGEPEGATGGF